MIPFSGAKSGRSIIHTFREQLGPVQLAAASSTYPNMHLFSSVHLTALQSCGSCYDRKSLTDNYTLGAL